MEWSLASAKADGEKFDRIINALVKQKIQFGIGCVTGKLGLSE